MKFQDWLKENQGVQYDDLIKSVIQFEDAEFFNEWATKQRLQMFGPDMFVLVISHLDSRIKELERKLKDKK